MKLGPLFCCSFRFKSTSFFMTKDKDDPDLSNMAAAVGEAGSQTEKCHPPPNDHDTSQTSNPAKPPFIFPPAFSNMAGEFEALQGEISPSAYLPDTPDSLSSEDQPGSQLSTPERPRKRTDKGKDKTSWTMITEPDPQTLHPDLDLTKVNNITRLLGLLQNGWVLSRGRGPRNHDFCYWCRGPIEGDVEILTHFGTTHGCKNSWPASCLMDWINQDLDQARARRLKCPMCAEEFYGMRTNSKSYFKANQGQVEAQSVLDGAWLRCVLLSPVYVRELLNTGTGKPVIFMMGSEVRKLSLFDKEKTIVSQCEGLLDPADVQKTRNWLGGERVASMLLAGQQLASQENHPPEHNLAAYVSTLPNDWTPPPDGEPIPVEPRFDTTWMLIDRGHNRYIISPLLTEQVDKAVQHPTAVLDDVRNMTAEEFKMMTKEKGGLAAAVKGFANPNNRHGDLMELKPRAEQWLQYLFNQSSQSTAGQTKLAFWRRVGYAYGMNITCDKSECKFRSSDEQVDDWEHFLSWSDEDKETGVSKERVDVPEPHYIAEKHLASERSAD